MSSRHLPAFDASIFDFTLRYQRVLGAQYHARPLSLLQQEVLYRCNGNVTIADLADATLLKHPEIRDALAFLASHGLIKMLPAEAWLFEPLPQKTTEERQPHLRNQHGRLLPVLKRGLRACIGWR